MTTMHRSAVRAGDIVMYDGERRRVLLVDGRRAYLQGFGWVDLPKTVRFEARATSE